jgi:hypothetical protein
VPTTSGTNTFTIVAKDASGNQTTKTYEIGVSGSGRTFTYDANGNLSDDGTRTFDWHSNNQIAVATIAGNRVDVAYDGEYRRRGSLR